MEENGMGDEGKFTIVQDMRKLRALAVVLLATAGALGTYPAWLPADVVRDLNLGPYFPYWSIPCALGGIGTLGWRRKVIFDLRNGVARSSWGFFAYFGGRQVLLDRFEQVTIKRRVLRGYAGTERPIYHVYLEGAGTRMFVTGSDKQAEVQTMAGDLASALNLPVEQPV